MSRLKHLAKKIVKSQHLLYDALSAATLTLTGAAPSIPFRCAVELSSVTGHTDCAGTVTVGSESLVFVAAGRKMTTNILSALPVVTTSGLNCHIKIECINASGQPIYQQTAVDLRCRIWQKTKRIPSAQGGWESIQDTFMWVQDFTINPGDTIKFDPANCTNPVNGEEHTVQAVQPLQGLGGTEKLRVLQF